MTPYLSLLRPNVCLLSAVGLLVGALIVRFFDPLPLLLATLATFLITGGGNAINDFFDVEADRLNRPQRPIPSGQLSRKGAAGVFAVVTGIGLLLAFFVNLNFFAIAVINAFVMVAYPARLKQLPALGNLAVSYLSASIFLAAGLLVFDFRTVWASPVALLALVSLLGTFAREVMKSIEDMKGDAVVRLRTLPLVAGEYPSRTVAYVSLFLACTILGWAGLFVFNLLSFVGFVPCFAACAYSFSKRHSDVRKAQKLIKVAMVLVMLGFLLGTA